MVLIFAQMSSSICSSACSWIAFSVLVNKFLKICLFDRFLYGFLTDFFQKMKNSASFASNISLKIKFSEKVLYTTSKRRP
jgi:hypothetical protein